MALDAKKLLDLIIAKFNTDLVAEHVPEDFELNAIPARMGYKYGYEATSTYLGMALRFRLYFNTGNREFLSKFKFYAIDDEEPSEDYTFVAKGTVNSMSITNNGRMEGIIPWTGGSGVIDPTKGCLTGQYVLVTNDW